MSVIVEVRVDGDGFELGRALDPPPGARVELRRTADGDGPIPFWVDGTADEGLRAAVEDRDPVEAVRTVGQFDGWTLCALDWRLNGDGLLDAAADAGGNLLSGRANGEGWVLSLRFPDESALSAFTDWCDDNDVDVAVEHRYVRSDESGYGLTERQRDTLERAVERGYYDIPRTTTTQELADELGISDQAVTERLRRAITTLARATLLAGGR